MRRQWQAEITAMNTVSRTGGTLVASNRHVEISRDAVAARIMPPNRVSVESDDVIVVSHEGAQVRIFFRQRMRGTYAILSDRAGTGSYGPVVEVSLDAPEFERVLGSTLEKVGAKLKTS